MNRIKCLFDLSIDRCIQTLIICTVLPFTGGCVTLFHAGPASVPKSTDDTYQVSARTRSIGFVWGLDVTANIAAVGGGVSDTRESELSNIGSNSAFFIRDTSWAGTFSRDCTELFDTSYVIKYLVFPFIPITKSFYSEEPIPTTVVPTITGLSVSAVDVPVNRTRRFTATVNAGPCVLQFPDITWSSSDTVTATVNQNGIVTGISEGPVTISAAVGGMSYDANIVVLPEPPVTNLEFGIEDPVVLEQRQISDVVEITAVHADGIRKNVTYSATVSLSSPSSVATFSGRRIQAGDDSGQGVLTAQFSGVSADLQYDVRPEITAISITPNPVVASVGNLVNLTATATREDGSTEDITQSPYNSFYSNRIDRIDFPNLDNQARIRERGRARVDAIFDPPASARQKSGEVPACGNPAVPGPFSSGTSTSGSSPASIRTILSTRHDRFEILREDDRVIKEFFIDKCAGDSIELLRPNSTERQYMVAVLTVGGDSVIEIMQGNEFVCEVTAVGAGFREVWLINGDSGAGSDAKQRVWTVNDEDADITVGFSPADEYRLTNIRMDSNFRTRLTRFYAMHNQNIVHGETYRDVEAGGVYSSQLDMDNSACEANVNWTVDNPGGLDDSGSGTFEWGDE